ncbi:hypothetical protein VTL71DRAFT_696 [Oculimacula yallundae]|uniref:PEBP-like protein n=1 Tax=Oculimacula yallundae TaxID=86028 RepID=A0ABR4D0R8_9HELO
MFSKYISAVLALSTIVASAPVCSTISFIEAARVKQAFSNAKITPDVVPFFEPRVKVSASYPTTSNVDLGNRIGTLETVPEPKFTFNAEVGRDPKTTKYLKLIIDPDAPGPDGTIQAPLQGVLSEFLHLAIEDAQPDCVTENPRTVRMYLNPTPLSVASHRYIFLVYRQPKDYESPLSLALTIPGLRLQQFVDKYKLELVGGNFYLQGAGTNLGGIGEGGPI